MLIKKNTTRFGTPSAIFFLMASFFPHFASAEDESDGGTLDAGNVQSVSAAVIATPLIAPTEVDAGTSEPVIKFPKGIYDHLTAAQKSVILSGETLVLPPVEVKDSDWPRVNLMSLVDATPEEIAGVAADYSLGTEISPDVHVLQNIAVTINTTDVSYLRKLPWPLSDEKYSIKFTVACSYKIEGGLQSERFYWRMLSADSTKAIEGMYKMEPIGNQTLVSYTNLIVPDQKGAGLFKSKAMDESKEGFEKVMGIVKKEKRQKPDYLKKQVADYHNAALGACAVLNHP